MTAGLKKTLRPPGRASHYLALLALLILAIGVAVLAPNSATSADEQTVRSAKLAQKGKSLILRVSTSREINLRRLDRRPDFEGGKQRYFCLEMNRRGRSMVTQICLGGRKRTYRAVGVSRASESGRIKSSKVIPAKVKKVRGKTLIVTFDPRNAGLSPGRHDWRIADRASGCPRGRALDSKDPDRCLSYYPSARRMVYRLRPIVAVGCTGGNGEFVRHGPRGRKRVALTFDDGPSTYTPAVLRILKRHKAKGTFFVLGQLVAAEPSATRRILAQGHELANHSYDHALLPSGSNIRRATRAIEKATKFRPCLFRPPYGAVDGKLKRAVRKDRMKTVNWDVDTDDWRRPGAAAITKAIVNRSRNGSIILMHDGGGPRESTVDALDSAIRGLKKKGYKMVTVTELLGNRLIYEPR